MPLSPRAQQFQDFLYEQGHEFTVLELPESTRTADDAASALQCRKEQIIKSLIFRTVETKRPVLVLASGSNRVNEKIIAQCVDEKIEKADADFVRNVTGFAIGGVPPVGHDSPLTVFVDEDLLQFDETWAAAGTPNAVFKITGLLTKILPQHTVLSIKK
ncbi:YbaK/EbsC family protein [Aquirhabdus parva]|uniref:YbaK/EbsC family protein n=1 Tax=Aquirhabdus parva TaxID=2283318 RepID=A0A345P409_9GAMM|nr:YbaK/EbsC family protein [Aquirhabdus parva]AXI02018.1 YbaK/EbsC family protein [Aquirhabdus parva]